MSLQPHHILLTVVAGESRALQRELAWGVPLARLSVGAGADWAIRGEGILDVHFHLSFDGRRLRAVAASPLAKVFAHGAELGCEWEDVLLPFELSFGSARLAGHVVGNAASRPARAASEFAPGQGRRTQPLDLARSDGLQTQLLDLSTLRGRPVDAHVTLSIDGAAAREPSASTLPRAADAPSAPSASMPPRSAPSSPSFQVVSGSTLAWSLGNLAVQPRAEHLPRAEPAPRAEPEPAPRTEPKPLATPRPEPPLTPRATTLTHTQCDGGALHDYARQLAAQRPEATQAGSTPPMAAATPLALRLGSLLTRAWVGARMAAQSAPRWQLWLGLSALATLMLLPLWATPSDEVHGKSDRHGTGNAARTTRLPTPDEGSRPTADGSAAPEAAELPQAGRSESSRVGASRLGALADGDSSPNAPEMPPANASAADHPAAADGATAHGAAAPASGEATPSSALEHDAFRAAFGGNLGEAIPLYEELAKQRREPVFAHAARLLRENRVHKP